MLGTVKYYNEQKGFGFIITEDKTDLFFHVRNTVGPEPQKGDTVSYVVVEGRRGPEATDVSVEDTHKE